jgi:hypothetical protein
MPITAEARSASSNFSIYRHEHWTGVVRPPAQALMNGSAPSLG